MVGVEQPMATRRSQVNTTCSFCHLFPSAKIATAVAIEYNMTPPAVPADESKTGANRSRLEAATEAASSNRSRHQAIEAAIKQSKPPSSNRSRHQAIEVAIKQPKPPQATAAHFIA